MLVVKSWFANLGLLLEHGQTTAIEIVLGMVLGCWLGLVCAVSLVSFRFLRSFLLPLLVVSQALPVFALAPLLVLWLGYGILSKVAMAVLIIFFPVAIAGFDGMRQTNPVWLDLAKTMQARNLSLLKVILWPACRPVLASGIRVAASIAPIGAVVGEWVGSSSGLGFLMLQANARMQIDLLFAALLSLCILALLLYASVNFWLSKWLFWVKLPNQH